ncbi:MAG: Ig-like domain-containing protein [Bacteroidota bacterium]
MKIRVLILLMFMGLASVNAQINFTAKDGIAPYDGPFRPGCNLGYFPGWNNEQLADLCAGNPSKGVMGIGARAVRPVLVESVLETFGFDLLIPDFEYFRSLGMDELTATLAFPAEWHRDQTQYCPGQSSTLFANLYEPIWDGGANGTPVNENNFFANYVYKAVQTYGDYVRFWEVWNEPGFDETGNLGWRQPGDPQGNWWDRDPQPCEYILKAPIQHYVRTIRIAYEVIKSLSPDDYVVVAGFGYQSFLNAVLRNTDNPNGGTVTAEFPHRGGAYFDIMGLHSYPHFDGTTTNIGAGFYARHSDQAAEGMNYRRDFYQEIFDRYGYDGVTYPRKRTIVTEINVPREFDGGGAYFATTVGQRNYIMKTVMNAILADVYQIHVYGLSDDPGKPFGFDKMGLYQNLNSTSAYNQVMNPEGIAYKTTADMLYGTTYDAARTQAMNVPPGIKGYALRNPDNTYTYMLWAATTQDLSEAAFGTYNFPASFGYSQVYKKEWNFSQTGASTPIGPSGINLDATPIFITETDDAGGGGGDNPPVVNLTTPSPNVSAPFVVTATFNEAVSGVELSDFVIVNGSISNLNGNGAAYTFTVTPTDLGVVTVRLPANTANDAGGNGNFASNTLTVNFGSGGGGGGHSATHDLSLSMRVASPTAGKFENIDFTITLHNDGPDEARNVVVEALFPDELAYVDARPSTAGAGFFDLFSRRWTVERLPAGQSIELIVTLFVLETTPVDYYAQVVAADGNDPDSTPGNGISPNPSEDDEAAAQLNSNGGGGGGNPAPTITLSTNSNNVAGPFFVLVQFSETVNGFELADIDVTNGTASNLTGSGALYSFEISPTTDGQITIAVAANKATDVDGAGNLASNVLNVNYNTGGGGGDFTDLELRIESDKETFDKFDFVTYTITVENTGGIDATNVIIELEKPDGTAFSEQDASQGTYSDWSGEWDAGTIAGGGSITLDVIFFMLDDSENITAFAQVKEMDQNDRDSAPDNNDTTNPVEDDEDSVLVRPTSGGGGGGGGGGNGAVDLSLDLTSSTASFGQYENIRYTLTIQNDGSETASGIMVDFQKPDQTAFVEQTVSAGTYSDWDGLWNVGSLASGQSATLDLTLFTLQGDAPIVAFAQVTAQDQADNDSSPDNNNGSVPTEDDEAAVTISPVGNANQRFATDAKDFEANQHLSFQIQKVFPNPVVNRLNVFASTLETSIELEAAVYNTLGKLVKSVPIQMNMGFNTLTIGVSELPSGTYFIRFNTPYRHEPVRFIKQ